MQRLRKLWRESDIQGKMKAGWQMIGRRLRSKKLWRNTAILFAVLLTASLVTANMWINGQDVRRLEEPLPEPSIILDIHGEPASQLAGARLVPVAFEDMPRWLPEAIVAVEDQRFYDHGGVDLGAMMRAFVRNAQAGGVVEGASTITQQLAKNLFLTSERTFERKLKEVAIAIKIDRTYSKDKILELYLNQIYFGEGAWGVQQAARTYFGVDVSELTLAQSALLAALPKAPSHYSPFVDMDKALQRRNLVLKLMYDQERITEAELRQAQDEPIVLHDGPANALAGQYMSYANHVMAEAEALYGLTEDELLRGGYRIYTNLDPKVQQAMEEVYREDELFPASPDDTIVQSGAVILDPRTGGIRGIVGRRGDPVFRGFNYATQLKRQPGSAFKPISVYAPALEAGYKPYSRLVDMELDFDGYQPRNADRRTRGAVTLEQAVERSYNIPTVWLLNELGVDKGLEYIHRFGIPTTDRDANLSLALGGMDEGVSPLQMASAYGAFANEGKQMTPHAISRIERKDGTLEAVASVEERQAVQPETAYAMTELLQGVIEDGTGSEARLDRPAAGKTGTTQLPNLAEFRGLSGARDIWFVGYTPELTAAVWMGYDQTDAEHYMKSSGGAHPARVFREMMTRALADEPVQAFEVSKDYADSKRWDAFRAGIDRQLIEWESRRYESRLDREEQARIREEERLEREERRERERLEKEREKQEKAAERERERQEREAEKARERQEREERREQERLEKEREKQEKAEQKERERREREEEKARERQEEAEEREAERQRQERERLREELERSGDGVVAGRDGFGQGETLS